MQLTPERKTPNTPRLAQVQVFANVHNLEKEVE